MLAANQNQPGWVKDDQLQKTYQVSIPSIERLREGFVENGLKMALKGKKREKYKEKVFDGA